MAVCFVQTHRTAQWLPQRTGVVQAKDCCMALHHHLNLCISQV